MILNEWKFCEVLREHFNVENKLYSIAKNHTLLFIGNQIIGKFGAPRTYVMSVTKSF